MRLFRLLSSVATLLLGAYFAWAAVRAHPHFVTGQFRPFPHPDGWITAWEKTVWALPSWMLPRHGDGAEFIWSIFYYLVALTTVFTFVGVSGLYREFLRHDDMPPNHVLQRTASAPSVRASREFGSAPSAPPTPSRPSLGR